MADLTFQWPDTQAADRSQAAAEADRASYVPGSAAVAAWNGESVTASIVKNLYGEKHLPDPNYRMDPEWLKQEASTRGIPDEHLHDMPNAQSQPHAEQMLNDIHSQMQDQKAVAQAGGWGMAANVGAAVIDPVANVAMLAGGAPGVFARGARITRMVKGGFAMAGANMSIEGYLASQQATRDPHEVIMAGAMGFMLGGGIAGLIGKEATAFQRAAEDIYNINALKSAKAGGLELTAEGEARLTASTEGFLPGSVGSAQIGEVTTPKSAMNYTIKVPFTKIEIPIRYDYAAIFDRNENQVVRKMGDMLLAESVGKEGGYAVSRNASETAALHQNMWRGEFYSAAGEAFTAHAARTGLNWVGRRMQSKEATAFFEDVTAAVRGDANVLARNPEAAKLAQSLTAVQGKILQRLKDAGVVGADEVVADPRYMMRKFNYDGIRRARMDHGPERLTQLISRAILSSRPEVGIEKADRIASQYMKKVSALQYDEKFHRAFATQADKDAILANLKSSLAPDEQEMLEDLLGATKAEPKTDSGASPRLKKRTVMDETFSMSYTGKDGVSKTLAVKDLFENDARMLFDTYARQTSGLYGMAKVGIKSNEDWAALKTQAAKWAEENFVAGEDHLKTMKHMDDVRNYILGAPMSGESFGKLERMARVLRDVNFMRMMGMSGAAQFVDMGNLIGLAGWRAFSTQMPDVGNILKLAKMGQLDDRLARDLANLGGFGTEGIAHNPMWRDINELTPSMALSKTEALSRKGADAVSYLSGLRSIDHIERTIASRVFAQKFTDMAHGAEKITPALRKHMAAAGLDEDALDRVLERLKLHSEVEGQHGKLVHIDYESWLKQSPKSYEEFQMAMMRETYRAVQSHTIGASAPWMHTTLGKVLTQFRTFSLVAYHKQLLYGIEHHSPQVAMAWSISSLFGAMQYVALTHLNFANDEKGRNERLTSSRIAAAAFNKAGYSSILPGILDTVTGTATGYRAFQHGRTSGLDTGLITGNPTYDLAFNKIGNTITSAAQSALTNDYVWTQKDVKNSLGLLPNLYGYRNFTHAMSSGQPTHNYLRQGLQQ